MMYIRDFEEFAAASERLFLERPTHTRYQVKYRNADGAMVVKVTDDVVVRCLERAVTDTIHYAMIPRNCLKYKSREQSDLKKLEKLTTTFLTLMSKRD